MPGRSRIVFNSRPVLVRIPGILIQGRLDLGGPLVTAWELAQAWPGSELVIVDGAGHSSTNPGISEAIIAATNHFATLRSHNH
jgi:proline iminopeptidase